MLRKKAEMIRFIQKNPLCFSDYELSVLLTARIVAADCLFCVLRWLNATVLLNMHL